MTEPLHIALCVPVRDTVKAGFAFDLAHLMTYWAVNHTPKGDLLYTDYVEGTLICNQRQQMADRAVEAKTTHVLFLDSDMRFPPDLIDRLVSHDKDVVCLNYSTRRGEIVPVCVAEDAQGKPYHVYTTPETDGLEKVFAAGMGGMLIKTSVFGHIEYPAFMIPWVNDGRTYIGEDIYFCRLLKAAGIEIWADHAASRLARHIGTIEYSPAHALQMRAEMEAHRKAAE